MAPASNLAWVPTPARASRSCRWLAAWHPGLSINFDNDTVVYPNGIAEHLRFLVGFDPSRHVYIRAVRDRVDVEVALVWRATHDTVIETALGTFNRRSASRSRLRS